MEGNNLDKGKQDSERRNTVLASLQKKNPGLIISYTLPVDPDGLSGDSQALLADAKAKGVKVHSANLMVMYFGKEFIGKGKSEGQLGIDSANTAYAQLQKIDPAIQVGLCPCLGRNGSKRRSLWPRRRQNPQGLRRQDAVGLLAALLVHQRRRRPPAQEKDRHQHQQPSPSPLRPKPWAFAKIFQTFTAR